MFGLLCRPDSLKCVLQFEFPWMIDLLHFFGMESFLDVWNPLISMGTRELESSFPDENGTYMERLALFSFLAPFPHFRSLLPRNPGK